MQVLKLAESQNGHIQDLQ